MAPHSNKINASSVPLLRKPSWIRTHTPNASLVRIKNRLRAAALHTVCEEAACPNLGECFSNGIATFLIMGNLCTRRCPFCDVKHGQPQPVNVDEPARLADTIAALGLHYVVVTSVDRDDLRDGGGAHFAACIRAIRAGAPGIQIEILTPDFRGRMELALACLSTDLPDIFNHNLETVPRLYRQIRPGADYAHSLNLLQTFATRYPQIPTKSGLMLGLGETREELEQVLEDLRGHGCLRLTLGQYLQPSRDHLPVVRFVLPSEFMDLQHYAKALGFSHVASAPMVRSSYHAELQSLGANAKH